MSRPLSADELNERIDALIDRVSEALLETVPRSLRNPNAVDKIIHWLYSRCVSRFDAIALLLKEGRVDDTLPIVRQLMNESHRVMYLAKVEGDERLAVALWWWKEEIKNIAEWVDLIERLDIEPAETVDRLRQRVKERYEALDRVRRSLGVGKIKPFPAEGEAICKAVGREREDLKNYKLLTAGFHQSALLRFNTMRTGEGYEATYFRLKDPRARVGIAEFATEWSLGAAVAAVALFPGMAQHESRLADLRAEAEEEIADIVDAVQRLP